MILRVSWAVSHRKHHLVVGAITIWLIYGQYMVIIWLMMVNSNLIGGFNHLAKYEFVNGKDDNPLWNNKTCLKPPVIKPETAG